MERVKHNFNLEGITNTYDAHNLEIFRELAGNTGLTLAENYPVLHDLDPMRDGDERAAILSRYNRLAERGNREFYRNLQEYYGLSSLEEASNLYLESLKIANNTREYVVSTALPRSFSDTFGQRNPVGFIGDPMDRFQSFMDPTNDIIDDFELYQQGILSRIAADLHPKINQEAHSRILDIDRRIEKLFSISPQHRKLTRRTSNVLHSNVTNEAISKYDYPISNLGPIPKDTHIKEHNYQARYAEGLGYVLTQPRIKSPQVAVVKAIDKAYLDNKELIDVDRDIYDPMGIMFVALSDNGDIDSTAKNRDKLAERVLDRLFASSEFERPYDCKEDHINGNRSISNGMTWQRYQLYYSEQKDPLELIFFDEKSYLNSKFKVGDLNDPSVKDRAHALYEVIRTQRVFPFFFPKEIYGGPNYDDIDLQEAMREKLGQTADSLFKARYSRLNDLVPR